MPEAKTVDADVEKKLNMSLDDLIGSKGPKKPTPVPAKKAEPKSKLDMSLDEIMNEERGSKPKPSGGSMRGPARSSQWSGSSGWWGGQNRPRSEPYGWGKGGGKGKGGAWGMNNNSRDMVSNGRLPFGAPPNSSYPVYTTGRVGTRAREDYKTVAQGSRTVKVTNIPFNLTRRDVHGAFAENAGPVEECTLTNGTAYIRFKSSACAKKAIETFDGGDMNGRRISACFA